MDGLTLSSDADLAAWVETQPEFEIFQAPNGKTKVKCLLTNHELLPVLETCKTYLTGKAYKKALRKREVDAFDFAQFEPHIIAHRTDPNLMYCVRTQVTLMRDKTAVQNYVKSRSYTVSVEHWDKGNKKATTLEMEKIKKNGKAAAKAAAKMETEEGDEDEEDQDEIDEDDDELTASEFAEMERLAVSTTSSSARPTPPRLPSPCTTSRCSSADFRWRFFCSGARLR